MADYFLIEDKRHPGFMHASGLVFMEERGLESLRNLRSFLVANNALPSMNSLFSTPRSIRWMHTVASYATGLVLVAASNGQRRRI
jgi:hypothetical protein